MEHLRRDPRFVTRQQVELAAADRTAVRKIWTDNISKGGLFVVTDDPPSLRSRVTVRLTVEGGELALDAEVVHVVAPEDAKAWGTAAGVGLQFVALNDKQRAALGAYCDGLAAKLAAAESTDLPRTKAPVNELQGALHALFTGTDANDLYGAIGVKSDASATDIEARLAALGELFGQRHKALPPAQLARQENALKLLPRIRRLLGDPARRLDHDLRRGLIRAEVLAQKPLHEQRKLRDAWKVAFPERIIEAESTSLAAAELATTGDYPKAAQLGEQALRLDPLNAALRETVREWKKSGAKKS
ncbi:MAG: PilZ domain-containing protein [Deltaproteobacteria bacterium]|jgi:Tfp pilus assembly protein PilZ|nr:PilZ domain-containing protein [Deltaproteobacteria bacterium]